MDDDDDDDDLSLSRSIEEIRLLLVKESFFLHEVASAIKKMLDTLWRQSNQGRYLIQSAVSESEIRLHKRMQKLQIEIAIDVKKAIEKFILLKAIQKRRGSFEKMVFFVKDYIDRRRDGRKVRNFRHNIYNLMRPAKTDPRITRIFEEEIIARAKENVEAMRNPAPNSSVDRVFFLDNVDDDDDVIVGRDEDIIAIKTKLIMSDAEWRNSSAGTTTTTTTTSSSYYVAYIQGDTGVGKTAVARKIYYDIDVRSLFDCFAWISRAYQSGTITARLLKDILSQLTRGMNTPMSLLPQNDHHQTTTSLILDEGADDDDVEIWKRRLDDFLKDKRYLIVIDGFYITKAYEEFFTSKARGLKGSRVIMVYTKPTLLPLSEEQIRKGYYFHKLEPLSEASSWEMFMNKVNNTNKPLLLQSFPDLESLAKQVVGKCNGIAQLILGTAKQLSGIENTYSAWFQFLNTQDKRNKTNHLDEIIASLPLDLQRCLSYLQFFPKNYEIPVRRLVALWIAEEMVMIMRSSKKEDVVPLEHKAMDYLQVLIDKEIVQVTREKLVDGRPKTCRLNQIWHQHLVSKLNHQPNNNHEDQSQSQSTTTTTTSSYYSSTVGIRQLPVYHTHNIEPRVMSNKNLSFDSYRFLLSFLCFDYRRSYEPSRQVKDFLRRGIDKDCFLSLKVLDLEGVYKPVLPKEIERLKNLRYLGLRWTYIDELPSFLGNLFNLRTLDVKHTYINTFPKWIHKLKHLQHLYMSENHRGKFVYRRTKAGGEPHLAKLQTLWGIFIDEESNLMNGLDMLTNIRKLGLMYRLSTSQQQDAMAQWLLKLDGVESLRLKSKYQDDKPSVLSLKDFNNHSQLSKMYLLGELKKERLHQHCFPPCLRKLTLSASKLQDDPMPILGMLPTLTILRLYSDSYVGLRMHCSSSSFVQLKVLKMWKLEKLEEWIVDKGSMPILEELDIRSCKGLNMLPAELQQITTIRELKLANMSETFTEQVKLDKSWSIKDNLYFADDQLDFPKKNVGTTLVANGASGSSLSSSSSSSSLGSAVLLILLARRGVLPSSFPTPTKHATPIGLISFNSLPG